MVSINHVTPAASLDCLCQNNTLPFFLSLKNKRKCVDRVLCHSSVIFWSRSPFFLSLYFISPIVSETLVSFTEILHISARNVRCHRWPSLSSQARRNEREPDLPHIASFYLQSAYKLIGFAFCLHDTRTWIWFSSITQSSQRLTGNSVEFGWRQLRNSSRPHRRWVHPACCLFVSFVK